MWHDLYKEADNQQHAGSKIAELRLTGLMTSPGPEVAKTKLGQYLQEAERLRNKNQYRAALIIVLVSGEYYWRKHQPTRAAGLLLEASDLFYLLENLEASHRSLSAALNLTARKPSRTWWENELMGNIFLLATCLMIIDDPSSISRHFSNFRNVLSTKQRSQISREDGYRVASAMRRAILRKSYAVIEELDTKTTLRIRSEYATLYEHLLGLTERYVLIRNGLITLQRFIQQEDH